MSGHQSHDSTSSEPSCSSQGVSLQAPISCYSDLSWRQSTTYYREHQKPSLCHDSSSLNILYFGQPKTKKLHFTLFYPRLEI